MTLLLDLFVGFATFLVAANILGVGFLLLRRCGFPAIASVMAVAAVVLFLFAAVVMVTASVGPTTTLVGCPLCPVDEDNGMHDENCIRKRFTCALCNHAWQEVVLHRCACGWVNPKTSCDLCGYGPDDIVDEFSSVAGER